MKTYNNLYPKICTWENLEIVYRKARKGKRKTLPVANFEYNWESNLLGGWFKALEQQGQPQGVDGLPQ